MKLTTSGGVKVATGDGIAWMAAQAWELVSRGYPAFVRKNDMSAELVRSKDGTWSARSDNDLRLGGLWWVREIVAMLNEQEKENAAHDNNHDVP